MAGWQIGKQIVELSALKNYKIREAGGGYQIQKAEGPSRTAFAIFDGKWWWVWLAGLTYRLRRVASAHDGALEESAVRAPMTGKVTVVVAKEKQSVRRGDLLVKMEAMKMEYSLMSPVDGIVRSVFAEVGKTVEADQVLVDLDLSESKA